MDGVAFWWIILLAVGRAVSPVGIMKARRQSKLPYEKAGEKWPEYTRSFKAALHHALGVKDVPMPATPYTVWKAAQAAR